MMAADVRVIERLTLTAPLGVRFWDTVLNTSIGDGLSVVAWPSANQQLAVSAKANSAGVYVFQHLPGQRVFEAGAGDAAFWLTPPPARPFVVRVQDRAGRFLPCVFHVDAPQRGIFSVVCGSPLGSPLALVSGVPLYSAPTRQVPAGMAVLRAELLDAATNAPAAWAVVDAHVGTLPPVRGVADAAGRLVLQFAYPEPTGFSTGSPLGGGGALSDQKWTIQLNATYAPGSQAAAPDLCDMLTQPPANLWTDAALTQPLTQVTLRFGQELIVRTGALPNLLITAMGSPA
jgi:hypothetical protein